MVAHVMRELRRQKIRLEKKRRGDDAMLETPPTITVRELVDLFPGISEGILRSRLKDRCSCISYKVNPSLKLLIHSSAFYLYRLWASISGGGGSE